MIENKEHIKDFERQLFEGNISNEEMVQLIELLGSYLNIASIPDYAKQNNLSYNGVKKTRNIITLFNQKFVVDND